MNFVKNLDQFGIVFTPRINKQQTSYQSVFGGLTSLIIYCASLSYCIYKFYLWQTYQLNPTTTNQRITKLYSEANIDNQSIHFSVSSSTGLNPFDPNATLLIPILQYYDGVNIADQKALLVNSSFGDEGYGGFITEFNISKTGSLSGDSNALMLVLCPCSDTILYGLNVTSVTCASNNTIAQFLQAFNVFHMTSIIKQFDPTQRKLLSSSNSFFYLLDPISSIYTQMLIQQTETIEDNGILFQSLQQNTQISDFSLISQTLSYDFVSKVYGLDVLIGIMMRLDSISNKQIITYPKLGSVLADIGSIMTTLLSLKLIISFVNQYLMIDDFYMKIISFYYPQIKTLKIKRNWIRQIKSITINDCPVDDVQGMITYINLLKSEAEQKLTALNTIYELSRLQFIVNSIQTRESLLLSHNVGIQLQYQQFIKDTEYKAEMTSKDEQYKLNDDDFNLLSLDHNQKVESELPYEGQRFYAVNQLIVN